MTNGNARRALVPALALGGVLAACGLQLPQAQAATASTQGAQQSDTVKITLSGAGDCTLGSSPGFPSNNFNNVRKHRSAAYFFKKVRSVFAADDLSIVNLEGTLTTRGKPWPGKTFTFRGSPSNTEILKKGSIEAVGFANNHCQDYGKVSRTDTIRYVTRADILLSSYKRVAVFKKDGVRVGMVSVSAIGGAGIAGGYDKARRDLAAGIKKLRKKKVSLIVANIHWGIEKKHHANAEQKSLAHYAVKRGANLVLGAHPHVLQGIEKYKGAYICYSLGNFCFGGNTNPADKDTMIFQQTFTFRDGKLVKSKSKKAKVVPCRLSGKPNVNNYQPVIAKGSSAKRILKRLRSYSRGKNVKISASGVVR